MWECTGIAPVAVAPGSRSPGHAVGAPAPGTAVPGVAASVSGVVAAALAWVWRLVVQAMCTTACLFSPNFTEIHWNLPKRCARLLCSRCYCSGSVPLVKCPGKCRGAPHSCALVSS